MLAAVAVAAGLLAPVTALPAAASTASPGPCTTVAVANDEQPEGTAATGYTTFTFPVSVGPAGCSGNSVNFHTQDGGTASAYPATAPSDYVATSGTLALADHGNGQSTPITVPVVPDSVPEPTEQFWVLVTDPTTGATLLTVPGWIDNDDGGSYPAGADTTG
jgi:hypothetical protein